MQGVHIEQDGASNICLARNDIAQLALASFPEAPGLFWIDSDMVFSVEDCLQLLDDFARTGEMTSGLCVNRGSPHLIAAFKYESAGTIVKMKKADISKRNALIEAAAVGFGFCITPRRLFEKMKYPWFGQPYELGHVGEDIAFCIRVQQQLKEKIWLDTAVRIGHVGEKVYTPDDAEDPVEGGPQ